METLDRLGIRVQLLSLPHLFMSPPDQPGLAATMARATNDRFASIVGARPDRFGAYATLPADDPDGALQEMRHAIDELRLDGICLTSNSGGRYLGDPFFEPILAEAARRSIPVFLHPAAPIGAAHLALGRPPFLLAIARVANCAPGSPRANGWRCCRWRPG